MSILEDLSNLQQHDGYIKMLEQQLSDIPKRIAQEQQLSDNVMNTLNEKKERLDYVCRLVSDSEERMLELERDVADLEKQKAGSSTHHQNVIQSAIETKEDRIDNEKARVDELLSEKRLLEQECDSLLADVSRREEKLAEKKAIYAQKTIDLEDKLKEAQEKRKEYVASLSGDKALKFLSYYERFKKKSWPVVAKLKKDEGSNASCGGCYMGIPQAKVQAIRRGDEMVTCDYCGRIIY